MVYDTGLAPNNIALLCDERIVMTFTDQYADRKILTLNIDITKTEISSHSKLFPGTRDLAIEPIHNTYPVQFKDSTSAIYLILVFENFIEKVQEATGASLGSFRIDEWISRD